MTSSGVEAIVFVVVFRLINVVCHHLCWSTGLGPSGCGAAGGKLREGFHCSGRIPDAESPTRNLRYLTHTAEQKESEENTAGEGLC